MLCHRCVAFCDWSLRDVLLLSFCSLAVHGVVWRSVIGHSDMLLLSFSSLASMLCSVVWWSVVGHSETCCCYLVVYWLVGHSRWSWCSLAVLALCGILRLVTSRDVLLLSCCSLAGWSLRDNGAINAQRVDHAFRAGRRGDLGTMFTQPERQPRPMIGKLALKETSYN
jgi:hypothetical protein